MADLSRLLSLTQAARLCPTKPDPSTLWRWCRKGVKAADGQRKRLKHVRVGARLHTRDDWLHDFFVQLADDGEQFTNTDHANRPDGRVVNDADDELARLGM